MPAQFSMPPSVAIPGVGVHTHEVTWMGRDLPAALAHEAAAAGLQLTEGGPDRITLTAGGVATSAALRAFVRASDAVDGDVRGILEAPYDRWQKEPGFGPSVWLLRLRGGGDLSPERLERATEVRVPVAGQPYEIPLLDTVGGRSESVHLSAALVGSVRSWVGLLWANLLGLGPMLFRELPGSTVARPARLAAAAIRAGSVRPERLGERLVLRGKGVRVHRQATVEASILHDGATVDAGAVVRHSIVGAGARVEAQALCLGSVIGPDAVVQRRGFVSYGVLDRGAVCGGTSQLAYIGPSAQLKVDALLLDQVLEGGVRVVVDGELHPAPLGVTGAGLGRASMVGARVTVAAGRLVGPQVTVVAGDGSLLLRPQVPGPGRYQVVGGALVPC